MITLPHTQLTNTKPHRRRAPTLHLASVLEMFSLESLQMFSRLSSSFAQKCSLIASVEQNDGRCAWPWQLFHTSARMERGCCGWVGVCRNDTRLRPFTPWSHSHLFHTAALRWKARWQQEGSWWMLIILKFMEDESNSQELLWLCAVHSHFLRTWCVPPLKNFSKG